MSALQMFLAWSKYLGDPKARSSNTLKDDHKRLLQVITDVEDDKRPYAGYHFHNGICTGLPSMLYMTRNGTISQLQFRQTWSHIKGCKAALRLPQKWCRQLMYRVLRASIQIKDQVIISYSCLPTTCWWKLYFVEHETSGLHFVSTLCLLSNAWPQPCAKMN